MKQIADEIGVEKQKVYRYIKKYCINEVHQKNGVKYYSESVQNLIKQGFAEQTASNEVYQNHINEAVDEAVIEVVDELKPSKIADKTENKLKNNEAVSEAVDEAVIEAVDKLKSSKIADKTENKSKNNEAVSEAVIEMLKKELEIKNEQIRSLQDQNIQLVNALQTTTNALHDAQALHAGTIKQQLGFGETEKEIVVDPKPKEPEKKSFWKKIFG